VRIKEALQRGTAQLDAEVLLAYTLGVDREYLIAHDDEEIEDFLVPVFEEYLRRVESGEPVAYITGQKEFYGLDFFVDKRVLIPRPETELLVEKVLEYLEIMGERRKRFRLLDVGTGSCNIPISIVKQYEASDPDRIESFTALEKEDGAMEVAKINISSTVRIIKLIFIKATYLKCLRKVNFSMLSRRTCLI